MLLIINTKITSFMKKDNSLYCTKRTKYSTLCIVAFGTSPLSGVIKLHVSSTGSAFVFRCDEGEGQLPCGVI